METTMSIPLVLFTNFQMQNVHRTQICRGSVFCGVLGLIDSIQEHTLAMEGIYAPSWRWEFYGKYGLRSSNANLSSLGLSSVSNTIHLAQLLLH